MADGTTSDRTENSALGTTGEKQQGRFASNDDGQQRILHMADTPKVNRCSISLDALIATCGLIIALTSCTVGPDFKEPAEPAAKAYTGDDNIDLSSSVPGETSQHLAVGGKIAQNWWALFHSRPLNDVIEQAVTDNRTLAAARATLAQAREAVAQASGALYPQVNFNSAASRQKASLASEGIPSQPNYFNLYSLGPTVSFALDPFGGNRRRVEQQAAIAESQDFQLDAAWLTLTGNAVSQVVNIASDLDQIKVIEDIIADDEHNLQLVQLETRSGELTKIDVASANSQIAADRALLPPLRQNLNVAQDALSLLVAKAPSGWKPPQLSLQDLSLPENLPLTMPSELVHQRPDILSAEAQLHAANAAIGVATAQLYPNITLSASVAQQALSTSVLFSPAANVWSLAGSLTAPIFEGGALEAQRRGAADARDAALATYEQTVLQSFTQVADVLHSLSNDAALLKEQYRAIDAAADSLRLMRATFDYGNVTLLQILDSERQLKEARLGYVRAAAQRYRDTVQLFVAMGGGWRDWRAQQTLAESH